MKADSIRIHRLRAATKVGVPDAERGNAQQVEISLLLHPSGPLADLGDRIENTIDYSPVSRRVLKAAATGERRLIETLAEDIAELLLAEFPLRQVEVEVRKFILPETEFVAVAIVRPSRDQAPGGGGDGESR